MIVAGTHYFPFAHLYGESAFWIAGAVQTTAGFLMLITRYSDSIGGYVMAGLLLAMVAVLFLRHRARSRTQSAEVLTD